MAFNLNNNLATAPTTNADWVRPSDWTVITDTPNEVQFLFADTAEAKLSLQITISGPPSVIIDWGDGTTTNVIVSGSAFYNKTYTKGTGAPCSRGYTTFVIRVYAIDPVNTTITSVRPTLDPSDAFGVQQVYYNVGLLEAYYGDGTQASGIGSYFASQAVGPSVQTFGLLEYVKMPAVVNSGIDYSFAFTNAFNLAVVILPVSSPGTTIWTSTFAACQRLTRVVFPSDTRPVRTDNMFNACNRLTEIINFPNLTDITRMDNMFQACLSLKQITIPPVGNVMTTDGFNSMFSACTNLTSVAFLGLGEANVNVGMVSMFTACSKLENVIFPQSVSSIPRFSLAFAFNGCSSLRSFTLPVGMDVSSYENAFSSCFQLRYCNLDNGLEQRFATIQNIFQNCTNLQEVILPRPAASISTVIAAGPFTNCWSLETLVIPDNNKWTSLALPQNVKNLTLPTSMNNVIGIAITGLNYLENLVLPSSMTALTSIQITSNKNLKTLTLPTSSMASVAGILGLSGNPVLEVINNMPTNAPLISFQNAFSNCNSLRSIILPATASATPAYLSTFANCHALESITFPLTQNTNTATTNMAGLFQNCGSLKTIVNFNRTQSASGTSLLNFGSNSGMNLVPGLTFSMRLTSLQIQGGATTSPNRITSLRLLNTNTGQWTGGSPQVNVSNTKLGYAALVQLFNDIAASGTYTSKTINITNATGAASLTAADRLILTSRGWTITG